MPTEGVDYLAVSADRIIWFRDAEAGPEEPGDECSAEWGMIALGWQTGVTVAEGDIGAEDLSLIVEGIIDKPVAGYSFVCATPSVEAGAPRDRQANGVTFQATTPLVDSGLSGLFKVRYVVGAAGLTYSPGIRGYHTFVAAPNGYVVVIVAYEDDVRVAAVLRPADKPPHLSMMGFLDLAIEALGIEALNHDVDLRTRY